MVLAGTGGAHHEGVGDRADIGYVHEVLDRIVGRLVEQVGRDGDRRAVAQHQRVKSSLACSTDVGADGGAAARLVVDHHRTARASRRVVPRSRARAASDAPPGGKVTTILTGRLGHCCAEALRDDGQRQSECECCSACDHRSLPVDTAD